MSSTENLEGSGAKVQGRESAAARELSKGVRDRTARCPVPPFLVERGSRGIGERVAMTFFLFPFPTVSGEGARG